MASSCVVVAISDAEEGDNCAKGLPLRLLSELSSDLPHKRMFHLRSLTPRTVLSSVCRVYRRHENSNSPLGVCDGRSSNRCGPARAFNHWWLHPEINSSVPQNASRKYYEVGVAQAYLYTSDVLFISHRLLSWNRSAAKQIWTKTRKKQKQSKPCRL